MKKNVLLIALGMALSATVIAQDLKPFKVDISMGYAIPGGKGSKGGLLFVVEPKYALLSQVSLGLRMEGAVVARFGGYDTDGNPNDVSVKASASYLATGDYYFSDNYSLRPFAGAGAGVFSLASVQANSSTVGAGGGSKFGGMVRAGVEISHFRIGIEYNIVPDTKFDGFDNNGDPAQVTSKNSYIGIKIGACLGGGPR